MSYWLKSFVNSYHLSSVSRSRNFFGKCIIQRLFQKYSIGLTHGLTCHSKKFCDDVLSSDFTIISGNIIPRCHHHQYEATHNPALEIWWNLISPEKYIPPSLPDNDLLNNKMNRSTSERFVLQTTAANRSIKDGSCFS